MVLFRFGQVGFKSLFIAADNLESDVCFNDAAGNRVFRSSMPQIELPGTETPQPIDTMITPGPDPRTGEAGPDPGSGEVEPVEEP